MPNINNDNTVITGDYLGKTDPEKYPPNTERTMENSYCRLNPINCGPVAIDLQTNFYGTVEDDYCMLIKPEDEVDLGQG